MTTASVAQTANRATNESLFVSIKRLLRKGRANWPVCLDSFVRSFGKTRQTASLPYPRAAIFIEMIAIRIATADGRAEADRRTPACGTSGNAPAQRRHKRHR